MAMVYDNLKGAFKEGKPTDEPKNNSGMMSRQLNTLSNAGPEGHSLAYITPEEEKLLKKATGKETITTAYGIPTYETKMTLDEMESKITSDRLEEIYQEAIKSGKSQDRSMIKRDTPQETDKAKTKSTEDNINFIYQLLVEDELAKYDNINNMRLDVKAADLIKRGANKAKGFFTKPKEGESSMEKIASGEATMDDKYSLYPAMNIMGYEVPGPRALLQEHIVKPLMNYLSKNKEEFNPTKDYHLNKFLLKKQQEMQSTEDYIPPQP